MARNGPWREFPAPLHALQSELNRLFDEYWTPSRFGGGGDAPRSAAPVDVDPSAWSPVVDLVENADSYLLYAEVPGVDPGSIDLSVTGNVVTLRGTKPEDPGAEATTPRRERTFGPFHRQIILNGEVDFDRSQAEARNGVLVIRFPKREAAKSRTIPVQTC